MQYLVLDLATQVDLVGLSKTSELIFAAIHAKSFDSESDIQYSFSHAHARMPAGYPGRRSKLT